MKTVSDVKRWCSTVALELGDPSLSTGQIFARFVPQPSAEQEEILAAWHEQQLHIDFGAGWLPISIDVDGPRLNEQTGAMEAFGIEQICPGFWTLFPSLNIPGFIHAFAHIYDVPSPAPWEQRIIVVGGDHRGVLSRILEKQR